MLTVAASVAAGADAITSAALPAPIPQPPHLHFSSMFVHAFKSTRFEGTASSLMIPVYLFIF